MSLPVDRQPLIAAFTLGIVFQAGAGAFFLYVGGQGKKIFRDGLRLALITFIASAALWSQIAFAATLIDPTTPIGCQIAIIFASSFDQLARFALEQYLIWAINSGLKKAPDTFVPQAILIIRLIIGGIFVGFQRPQLDPVCQTSTNMFAVGIAVIASDAVMILIFVARAFMIGLVQDVREKRPGVQRSKAVLFLIAGLALWTGASVPMFLGIQSVDLIWRSALPAGALTLLLGLVSAFLGVLVLSRARASVVPHDPTLPPDMRSPRDSQGRDLSSAESNYPPGRFEDLKADEAGNVVAYPSGKQVVVTERSLGNIPAYPAGTYGSSAGVAVGIAVGRPSMDGRGLSAIPTKPPQMREDQWSNLKAQPKQKGSIFTRGAPASSITVGKLAISNPILQSEAENPALNKIATVDLATAAQMERDRRDLATLQDAQSLIAQRAAPLPPAMTREEALRRAQSTKRKQIGTPFTELLAPPNQIEADFSQPVSDDVAVATSSQPSPGTRSLRKRSPRSPPKEFAPSSPPVSSPKPSVAASDVPLNGPAMVAESSAPSRPLTIATLRGPPPQVRPPPQGGQAADEYGRAGLPPTWPKQRSVNNTIRPSRTSPDAVQQQQRAPQASPESQVQTVSRESPEPSSLQRRGTVGLPSNPRSRGLKTPGKEGAPQPTVMFVNQIEYNDPVAVQTIMQDAAAPKTTSALRESVLHRPRPIPRQHEKDRQIFPAEQSPVGHRRTRSGGSIASRLRDQPASPPNLPPLPPAPKSAGYPVRPLPNDTRSMTFDEKMDLFFPAPRSAAASVPSRSSIPEIPALPSAYLMERNDSTASKSSRGNLLRSPTRSTNSTKTSVRTQSILDIESTSPARPPMPNVSKFSIDTYITAGGHGDDEAGNSWIPDILPKVRVRSEQSNEGAKRRSSPVLPLNDGTMSEFSDNKNRADEETATNWGSVHSPVIMEARQVQVPVPTLPMMYNTSDRDRIRDLSVLDPEGGKELMTIMLDPSVERERNQAPNPPHQSQGHWHHRLGEECATFSTRKERVVSRRMPPPTPLLLNITSKKSFVIAAAEPSPLESPEKALQAIHDQLKMLDGPDGSTSDDPDQRLRLLESLEQEMGQQEDQWHEMQIGIHRDSLTTVETSSRRVSHQDMKTPEMASERPGSVAPREARRSTRLQVPNKLSLGDLSAELMLSPGSRPRSLWQRKLAAAELEFSESAADYLAPMPGPNFVAVPMAQLGSPTPPDTDSDDEEILRAREVLRRRNAPVAKLWNPKSPLPAPSRSLLWAPPTRLKPIAPEDIPGVFVRPVARNISEPLPIATSQLWADQSTFVAPVRIATVGLWRGAPIPKSPAVPVPKVTARPLTQRPPRKLKRVSTLPDIVENPEPLPNKRGTLGIFQFPWGEKSDTATIQARASNLIMAMPGTMSTGGSVIKAALEARSKQLEQDEYSSSFFDDYDEEEEDDDTYISEINGVDSDDEFDETTLWEIASLLKSDQVPSKYSLLPQRQDTDMDEATQRESMFEASDYETEEDEPEERLDLERQDFVPARLETHKALAPASTLIMPDIGLWSDKPSYAIRPSTLGLPQPDEQSWAAYIPTVQEAPRAKPRQSEVMPLESTALWASPATSATSAPTSVPVPISAPTSSVGLWSVEKNHGRRLVVGLPQPDERSWAAYIPTVEEVPRAKSRQLEDVVRLQSTSLWAFLAGPAQAPAWEMWTAPAAQKVQSLEKKTKKGEALGTQSMWMAPVKNTSSTPSGLFDPKQKRPDYRTSPAEPAALNMARKPRTVEEPMPQVPVSSDLWVLTRQPVVHNAETFWMTPAPPIARAPPQKTKTVVEVPRVHAHTLWVPDRRASDTEPRGLFSPSQRRITYRTTSAEPAALGTVRRPRINEEPLAQLSSRELWTVNNSISYEYDWITIASVGPQSPSYASSSGRSTPISESSSVKTNSTMASSMAPSITQNTTGSGFPGPRFPTWWEPTEKPSRLSVLPEGPEEPRIQPPPKPLSPAERRANRAPKPVPARSARRPASSTADWDSALQQAITSGNRLKHRKATPRDWDHALNCAMAASRPTRKAATPADWAAALSHAVALSSTEPSATAALWTKRATAALWTKRATAAPKPSDILWTPSTALLPPPSSPLPTAHDIEASRLRRRRVKAMIPKSRKAEIRAQIAAIEAGVDPSIVGLVNFRGQSLWAPRDGLSRRRLSLRGAGRNWIVPQAPVRASQAVFKFWLPGTGEAN